MRALAPEAQARSLAISFVKPVLSTRHSHSVRFDIYTWEGKLTLRTYKVEVAPLPKVDSKFLRDTRKKLRCSRAVFARRLRINERTLEKWEQGRAKPNPQAAALVLLVRKYPHTLAHLDELAAR
jgi:putative transcriptional regulator